MPGGVRLLSAGPNVTMRNNDYLDDKTYEFKTDIAYMSNIVSEVQWLDALYDLRCLFDAKRAGRPFRSVYLKRDVDDACFDPLQVSYVYGGVRHTMDVDFEDIVHCNMCEVPVCGCAAAAREGKCMCFNLYHSLLKKPGWVVKVEKHDSGT